MVKAESCHTCSATVCSELALFNAFLNKTAKGMQHMFVTSPKDTKAGCDHNSTGGQDQNSKLS